MSLDEIIGGKGVYDFTNIKVEMGGEWGIREIKNGYFRTCGIK